MCFFNVIVLFGLIQTISHKKAQKHKSLQSWLRLVDESAATAVELGAFFND